MELRHLRYFVAVAEEESVSRAAKRLHVSHSPLSRQIRDLERELGIALFARSAKALRLIRPGRVFLLEARAVLQRAEDAVAFTKAVAQRKRSHIRVGHLSTPTAEILPRTLRAFQRTNPEVSVDLRMMSPRDMLRALRAGGLDLALLGYHSPEDFQGLSIEELGAYPSMVAFHRKHRFTRLREVPISDIAAQPIIAISRQGWPGYHVQLAKLLSPYTRSLNIVEEYDGLPSIIAAVEAGRGVSVVNQSMSRICGKQVVLRPLKPRVQASPVVLAYRKEGVTATIAAFVAAARTAKLR